MSGCCFRLANHYIITNKSSICCQDRFAVYDHNAVVVRILSYKITSIRVDRQFVIDRQFLELFECKRLLIAVFSSLCDVDWLLSWFLLQLVCTGCRAVCMLVWVTRGKCLSFAFACLPTATVKGRAWRGTACMSSILPVIYYADSSAVGHFAQCAVTVLAVLARCSLVTEPYKVDSGAVASTVSFSVLRFPLIVGCR